VNGLMIVSWLVLDSVQYYAIIILYYLIAFYPIVEMRCGVLGSIAGEDRDYNDIAYIQIQLHIALRTSKQTHI